MKTIPGNCSFSCRCNKLWHTEWLRMPHIHCLTEIQNRFSRANNMVPTRLCSHLWRLAGRIYFMLKAAHGPGSVAPFAFKATKNIFLSFVLTARLICLWFSPPALTYKDLWDYTRSLDNGDRLPVFRPLAASPKSFSPCNTPYSPVPGIRTGTSLQGRSSAFHTEHENTGSEQLCILPFHCGSSTCKPMAHVLGMRST